MVWASRTISSYSHSIGHPPLDLDVDFRQLEAQSGSLQRNDVTLEHTDRAVAVSLPGYS